MTEEDLFSMEKVISAERHESFISKRGHFIIGRALESKMPALRHESEASTSELVS